MDTVSVAVLGAGSIRCSPAVIGCLATYFGERELQLRFWDSDQERLDLFDRFARLCFAANQNEHHLSSTEDLTEALDEAEVVILQVGENCARRHLRSSRRMGTATLDSAAMIEQSLELLVGLVPANAAVLSLQRRQVEVALPRYYRLDWPSEPSDKMRAALPHQILRYINGEEYLHEFLRQWDHAPLRAWLDDPSTAELVKV